MIIYIVLTNLLLVRLSQCSLVMDVRDPQQKAIHIADYCPTMPYCSEGSHVMCMYYNPHNLVGPRCYNAKNISMTADIASKVVDTINEIRSKLALGQEKGQDGVSLPRAYGMMKLQWDSELATFAQVWANQCMFRHDVCRATLNFASPNQMIGLVRFTYPGWLQVSGPNIFETQGFNEDRVEYAITTSLKTWYTKKDFATPPMMTKVPDWTIPPHDTKPKLYLAMIHAETTHVGCGISAYTEYGYHDNNADLNYNYIVLICNLSTKPKPGTALFKVTPPSIPGETIRCGCPEGYEEDPDCLCSKINMEPMPIPMKKCSDCKPSVVLLPIITVEDAPPDTIATREGTTISDNVRYADIFPNATESPAHVLYNAPEHDDPPINNEPFPVSSALRSHSNSLSILDDLIETPRATQKPITAIARVENRYFGRKTPTDTKVVQQRIDHAPKKKKHKQGSIFSKAHTFALPGHRHFKSGDKLKDVAPRKDFSQAQTLLNTYLNKKRNHEPTDDLEMKTKNKGQRRSNHKSKFDQYLRNKFNYEDFNVSTGSMKNFASKNCSEEADAKLMNLLDTLEQEVKHIELDMNEKEIFDAKIRKIYGTVVGGSTNLINNRRRALVGQKDPARYSRLMNKVNADSTDDINKMVYENEDKVKEAHSKFMDKYSKQNRLFKRPLTRNDKDRLKNGLKSYRHTLDLDLKDDTRRMKHDPFMDKIDNPLIDGLDFRRDLTKKLAALDGELKSRRVFKSNRDRMYYDDNKYKSKDTYYDDPLSADRRKYYQEKIDNIERKIHENRNYRFRKQMEQSAAMRLRPTNRDDSLRPSRTKDMFYIPDRARFLHGF